MSEIVTYPIIKAFNINVYNGVTDPETNNTIKLYCGGFSAQNDFSGHDFRDGLNRSIKETVIDGKIYKTCYYVTTGAIDSDKISSVVTRISVGGHHATVLNNIIPENSTYSLLTLCNSKGILYKNHFSATSGGNSTGIKPYMGKYYIGTTVIDGFEIGISAYLSNTNDNESYICGMNFDGTDYFGWVLLQKETNGKYSVFASFVSANYWENAEVAPFGNTTPTGTIGGYGTYDDTSDSIPVPDNYIDDIYANAFGGNGMHLYGVSGEGLKNFLSKVYTTDFWQHWENAEVAPFGTTTPTGAIGGYGTYDNTSDSIPVPDNYIDDIYANAFGGNGMHLYGVSGEGLKNFLSKVYTTDFWQYWANTMFNPMDGIISCLYLPVNYGLINGANTNSVHVSNAELETGEGKVKILYNYTYDTSTGVLPVEEYFGSFLDYAPYTSAELYLPFYGTVPINIDSIMGGSIKVQYRINLVTGTFSVFVICVDRFGVQTILQYAGSCGMSIPIVSGNNGAQNRITDLVQGLANVALGNYVGAGMNAVNALTEKGYVYTNSKISGSAGYDGVKDVFLTITRPVVSNPEKYSEIKQRPADMFVKLSDLRGEYSIEKQNLDIHDENITDEEIAEIENLLQGGVIF